MQNKLSFTQNLFTSKLIRLLLCLTCYHIGTTVSLGIEESLDQAMCANPTDLRDSLLTDSTVQLFCTKENSTNYRFRYRMMPDTQWIDFAWQFESTIMIDSLSEGTYEWTVQANCVEFGLSEWADTLTFQVGMTSSYHYVAENEWSIYPNPAQEYVEIKLPVGFDAPNTKIQLHDVIGQPIALWKPSSSNRFNLSGIEPGSYFIRISQGSSRGIRRLVVFQ